MASGSEETNARRCAAAANRWVCPVCGEEMLMGQAMRGFCETDCPLQPLGAGPEK